MLMNGLKALAIRVAARSAKRAGQGASGIDVCSSGRWFRGWKDANAEEMSPVARARTWLLGVGWRRGGLISTRKRPAS
jgi:hypothetical protein